jgi:ROK family
VTSAHQRANCTSGAAGGCSRACLSYAALNRSLAEPPPPQVARRYSSRPQSVARGRPGYAIIQPSTASTTLDVHPLKEWKDTERFVIGGGFRGSRVGELVIGRAAVLLKADKINVKLLPIHIDPDEAGLLGAVHLAPAWMFKAFDAILGVDIGGTSIRAGVIQLNLKAASDFSKTKVWKYSLWRHGDEEDIKREHAVESLVEMLRGLIAAAKKKGMKLAPFIGVGCPGLIEHDGSIDRGAQNLPGNWESKKFNLPVALHSAIPTIGDHETSIVMHNDAVVQGLSEIPYMRDAEHWGVFTIGTGLGNARFTNRNTIDE